MSRIQQHAVVIATAVVLAVITTATVLVVNHAAGHSGCTVLRPFGWAALVATAAVLTLAARALLLQRRASSAEIAASQNRCLCASCGHHVHGAWRMCPYCGSMLDVVPDARGGEVQA